MMTIRTIFGSTLTILTLTALLSLAGQAQAASHEMGHDTMMNPDATHMGTDDMNMDDMKMDHSQGTEHMMQDGTMMDGDTHQKMMEKGATPKGMMHDGTMPKGMMHDGTDTTSPKQ